MTDTSTATYRANPAAAGARLGELLAERAEYRTRWERKVGRRGHERVHHGAVAQVLAAQLWESGEVAENDTELPRRLKDIVSRALAGKVLSASTLRTFVSAFAMSPDDGAQLWALLYGRDHTRIAVVRDDLELSTFAAPARPAHQTVSIHEFHRVGEDGLPESHRTVHVLRALEPISCYPYIFDTDAAVVEVMRGGVPGPLYQLPEHGMYAVDLLMVEPIPPGSTVSLEYLTLFSYRNPPPREFRRGTRQRIDNLEVNVTFHPARRPSRVWWAVWENHTHREPVRRDEVPIGSDGSVHRYLDSLSGYTVGFQWDW